MPLIRLIKKITSALTGKSSAKAKPKSASNDKHHAAVNKRPHAKAAAETAARGRGRPAPQTQPQSSPSSPRPPRGPRPPRDNAPGKPAERSDRPDRGERSGRGERGNRFDAPRGRSRRPAPDLAPLPKGDSLRPGGAVSIEERERRKALHTEWNPASYQVPPEEGKRRFEEFALPNEIVHAIADLGFQYCTPIQALSLEHALAGRDIAGKAQTGTGKTAAFLIAILTRYLRSPEARKTQVGRPRALVLAPTRELVIQICKDADALGKYCGLRYLAIYGGMDYNLQQREIQAEPVDLVVATPGRLIDFIRNDILDLGHIDTLVIDEADRMLDMGFIPDVRRIINKCAKTRCTMLYSATLSDIIVRLAGHFMTDPFRIEIESESPTIDTINQVVYAVAAREKLTILYNLLRLHPDARVLVFCNRRTSTEFVAEKLHRLGVRCDILSGDVNQNRRLQVLEAFRAGKLRVVIATDVAGRGIHVENLEYVVNYDFPYEAEDYVHRIGRTGRAGQTGTAISFADEDESFVIPQIEKYINMELKCTQPDDELFTPLPDRPPRDTKPPRGTATPPPRHEPQPTEASPSAVAEPQPCHESAGENHAVAEVDSCHQPEPAGETSAVAEPVPCHESADENHAVAEPAPCHDETRGVAEPAPHHEPAEAPAHPGPDAVSAQALRDNTPPAVAPEPAHHSRPQRSEEERLAAQQRRAERREAGERREAEAIKLKAQRKAERMAAAERMNAERHAEALKRRTERATQRQTTAERHAKTERYETPEKSRRPQHPPQQPHPRDESTGDASTSLRQSNWRTTRGTPPIILNGPTKSEEWTPGG